MAEQKQYPPFVAYHFLDIDGELMAMEESGKSTEKFLKNGFEIDGSSIKGMAQVEKSDLKLRPEPESFLKIKIGDFVHHRFLAHFEDEYGQPFMRDPKAIYQKVIDKCRKMGYEPSMFSEVEFYIVDKVTGKPVDDASYCFLPPHDVSYEYRHQLGEICEELGIAVKRIHHECGPGQNEIELNFQPCMKNADDTTLCKWIMDMLAEQRGQKILYSPKPFKGIPGNGLHHHILLRDIKTGENIFYNKDFQGNVNDPKDYMKRLSENHKHFTAGLLKYADEITAVFGQSPETFKRLQPGFEAPIYKTWDFSNRTALVRVPKSTLEMTRMEYRGGDYSGSVHLYGAILLAAGLKGIEDKLELGPNSNFNVDSLTPEEAAEKKIYKVPLSFEKTLEVFKTSAFMKEAIGEDMVNYFIKKLTQKTKKVVHEH